MLHAQADGLAVGSASRATPKPSQRGRHGVRRITRRKAFETHVFSACRLVNWLIVLFTLALNRVLPSSLTTTPQDKNQRMRMLGWREGERVAGANRNQRTRFLLRPQSAM